jgi:hypothetical protein
MIPEASVTYDPSAKLKEEEQQKADGKMKRKDRNNWSEV